MSIYQEDIHHNLAISIVCLFHLIIIVCLLTWFVNKIIPNDWIRYSTIIYKKLAIENIKEKLINIQKWEKYKEMKRNMKRVRRNRIMY